MAQDAKPGGEIVVTYKDDVATLDPAIGYDWQNWSMIKALFDGLMDYEPGTTELRPDLAESYEISDDQLTYTFHLRQGPRWSDGASGAFRRSTLVSGSRWSDRTPRGPSGTTPVKPRY